MNQVFRSTVLSIQTGGLHEDRWKRLSWRRQTLRGSGNSPLNVLPNYSAVLNNASEGQEMLQHRRYTNWEHKSCMILPQITLIAAQITQFIKTYFCCVISEKICAICG
jgi:hypothetical protein